jgi:hypothetical protein
MSAGEAAEWLASSRLDPIEEDRADVRHALMMELLLRIANPKAKQTAMDFLTMLPWRAEERPEPPSPELVRQKIEAAMLAFGGKH